MSVVSRSTTIFTHNVSSYVVVLANDEDDLIAVYPGTPRMVVRSKGARTFDRFVLFCVGSCYSCHVTRVSAIAPEDIDFTQSNMSIRTFSEDIF